MKNGKVAETDWESRIARLETELKEIKALLQSMQENNEPSWKSMVGIFANNPAAEEVDMIVRGNRAKERAKACRIRSRRKVKA